jgi:hypothetical protein
MIAIEISTALAMLLVLLMQRPGVTTPEYARKHNQESLQRKRAAAAQIAANQFREGHATANWVFYRAGGIALWGVGLCIVILSAPHLFNSDWPDSKVAGFGLVLQLVGSVLYVFWGLLAYRTISKAVRAQGNE